MSGAVTDIYAYDAFGRVVARTGATDNEFLFNGQHYDANVRFYYLRARYYHAEVGRFTSLDPWAGDPYAPATLHKYLYAASDPVNKVDPTGKFFGVSSAINVISVSMSIANSFFIGYQIGTLINKAHAGDNLLSADNIKTELSVILSLIPMHWLTDIAKLSKVARIMEKNGWTSKIYDSSPNLEGFEKVYHWVRRMQERGISLDDVLKALSEGTTYVDSKSGAIAKALGDGKIAGTVKVIIDKGKIVTVYAADKLSGKFQKLP